MKANKFFKGALSLLCAVMAAVMLLPLCVGAEGSYISVSGYARPGSLQSVVTSDPYPWTYADGVLRSGNANVGSSVSVLKLTVSGNGALVFKYRVSAPDQGSKNEEKHLESNPDSFVFWKNYPENLDCSYSEMIGKERVYGQVTEWTTGVMTVTDAESSETTDFYLIYKKNGSLNGPEDCVWIKDLAFLSGSASVSPVSGNEAWGTVSTDAGTIGIGGSVTVTAQPKDGCDFYGWVIDGKLVSEEKQYTFPVYGDTAPLAVFGNGETAARNLRSGLVYQELDGAMRAAQSGDAVMLLRDCTVGTDTVIPAGVRVYVPYSAEYDADGSLDGTEAESKTPAGSDRTYLTLTVAQGASLTVKGTLCVGGVIGYPGQFDQGHTSGAHGKLLNNGSVTVAAGGVLDCFGYVEGSGKVTLQSGAKAYEPFLVCDYSGGTNTKDLVFAGQSPFALYTMQNIRCALDVRSGAALMGRCNLYASAQYNKTDAVVIGENGLISPENGAVLHRTVDLSDPCGELLPGLGRVSYEFAGGASFRYLTMELFAGVDPVTTKDILFPIPFCYRYTLTDGTYAIDTDIVLMPGTEMTVAPDAELLVNDRFTVLDGLEQSALSGKAYPTTAQLKNAGYPTNAALTVNGTMKLADGVQFVGTVQTADTGAELVTGAGCDFEEDIILGAETTYGNNRSVLPLQAQVMTAGGLKKLESGKTYAATGTGAWTLSGYRVDPGTGVKTVTTDQTVYGTFCGDHSFTAHSAEEKYFVSAANCQHGALYRVSCADCGAAGEETFESGAPGAHSYAKGVCTVCGAADPDAKQETGIAVFINRIIAMIRDLLKRLFFWM